MLQIRSRIHSVVTNKPDKYFEFEELKFFKLKFSFLLYKQKFILKIKLCYLT